MEGMMEDVWFVGEVGSCLALARQTCSGFGLLSCPFLMCYYYIYSSLIFECFAASSE